MWHLEEIPEVSRCKKKCTTCLAIIYWKGVFVWHWKLLSLDCLPMPFHDGCLGLNFIWVVTVVARMQVMAFLVEHGPRSLQGEGPLCCLLQNLLKPLQVDINWRTGNNIVCLFMQDQKLWIKCIFKYPLSISVSSSALLISWKIKRWLISLFD